jgi:hypothetical protein
MTFHKGQRVYVESHGWPYERYHGTIVRGPSMKKWEGVGRAEPHYWIRFEGDPSNEGIWEPARKIHAESRENPEADVGTIVTVLAGAFVLAGGLAYFFYSLSHAGTSSEQESAAPVQTGTDVYGNPTYAAQQGGTGVFSETSPGAIGPAASMGG